MGVGLVVALALGGCYRGDTGMEKVEWVQQENPLGFTVTYPRGSRVETSDDGRVVIRLPNSDSMVIAQPFVLNTPLTAEGWLKGVPARFTFLFPNAQSGEIRPLANGTVREELVYGTDSPSRAALVCSIDGTTGMLYALAAPRRDYERLYPTLKRIAGSFGYATPKITRDEKTQPYTAWSEPNEGMFLVDVPDGWETSGGLFRLSAFDSRLAVASARLDGKARVVIGDSETPPYAVLTEQGAAMGMTEGMPFNLGDGTHLTLRAYTPGLDYAREYVQKKLAADLPNVTFTGLKELPTVAEALKRAQAAPNAISPEISVGSVEFAATKNGRPYRGYCLVGTARRQVPGIAGAIWTVDAMYGYVAEAEAEADAQDALFRMTTTLRVNPDWVVRQKGLVGNIAETLAAENDAIASALRAALHRLRATDSISNMTFGATEYRDPSSGTKYHRATSGNAYWQKTGEKAPGVVPVSSL